MRRTRVTPTSTDLVVVGVVSALTGAVLWGAAGTPWVFTLLVVTLSATLVGYLFLAARRRSRRAGGQRGRPGGQPPS